MAATAIVVPFSDLDAIVGTHRRALTSDGADGMPPHVTLIYPFVDDADLSAGEVGRLRRVFGAFAPFDVTFSEFGRFDARPPVLYLAPEPAQPFLEMVAALAQEFPAHPPFGGVHETVIPHLTVAHAEDATALRGAEDDVRRHLPVHARVNEVTVMEHRVDGWCPRERIALNP